MWVPPEVKDQVVLHAPTRKSVACFGAVGLSSGKFVRFLCKKFDALTFEAFLKTWTLARRMATHNRFLATLSELLAAVGPSFDRWQKPNAVLRRLYGIIQDAMFKASSTSSCQHSVDHFLSGLFTTHKGLIGPNVRPIAISPAVSDPHIVKECMD